MFLVIFHPAMFLMHKPPSLLGQETSAQATLAPVFFNSLSFLGRIKILHQKAWILRTEMVSRTLPA